MSIPPPRDIVERAESLRAAIAGAALHVRQAADTLEPRFASLPSETNLGRCCRLIEWTLLDASTGLEPLTVSFGDRSAAAGQLITLCDKQRQRVLASQATATALLQLMRSRKVAHDNSQHERGLLSALPNTLEGFIPAFDSLRAAVEEASHATTTEVG